jgi:hypothetical protein
MDEVDNLDGNQSQGLCGDIRIGRFASLLWCDVTLHYWVPIL